MKWLLLFVFSYAAAANAGECEDRLFAGHYYKYAEMSSPRLRIRLVTAKDRDDVLALIRDPEIASKYLLTKILNRRYEDFMFDDHLGVPLHNDYHFTIPPQGKPTFVTRFSLKYVVHLNSTLRFAGLAGLKYYTDGGEWEISFAVAQDLRCQGIGEEIVRMLIAKVRGNEPMAVIRAQAAAFNAESVGLLERTGFRRIAWPQNVTMPPVKSEMYELRPLSLVAQPNPERTNQ